MKRLCLLLFLCLASSHLSAMEQETPESYRAHVARIVHNFRTRGIGLSTAGLVGILGLEILSIVETNYQFTNHTVFNTLATVFTIAALGVHVVGKYFIMREFDQLRTDSQQRINSLKEQLRSHQTHHEHHQSHETHAHTIREEHA